MKAAIRAAESGWIPDRLIRWGIRGLLRDRLRNLAEAGPSYQVKQRFIEHMSQSPVALTPEKANDQHYEVPPAFYKLVLGPHLKYSSCWFDDDQAGLGEAESAMLELTCERAGVKDGMRVLDLGCGWGSLSLWIAERFPGCTVTGVSNSAPQKEHILAQAKSRGLANLDIITADMNHFAAPTRCDRILSVEMFEHMRNWELLLRRAKSWLLPEGRIFLHVFAHKEHAYPYEVKDDSDWMSAYFFTGGMMPSNDLLEHLDTGLAIEQHWVVNGTHYAHTAERWLQNLDSKRSEVLPILRATYGKDDAFRWYQRWRLFFLACAELFAYRSGKEWWVAHTLLRAGDSR